MPSVTGVAAPATWLAALAESLAAETGGKVRVASPAPEAGGFGVLRKVTGEPVEVLYYHGVARVSADFVVDCGTAVTGTFVGWSSATIGGVACQYQEFVHDPYARLALAHCSTSPAPPPSGPPAAEWPAD